MEKQNTEEEIQFIKSEILRTQQYIARFTMINAFNVFELKLHYSEHHNQDHLMVDEKDKELQIAIMSLNTADDPLMVAQTFNKKCYKELERLGIWTHDTKERFS